MTPAEFIAELNRLADTGCEHQALEFAARYGPEMIAKLTDAELAGIQGLMETVVTMIALREAEATAREGIPTA